MRAAKTGSGVLSWPALRSHIDILQTLTIGIGLTWSVVFLVAALHYELELYADGAVFSYAVAVQDVWAFHWHNISARASVFVLTLLPAEIYVGLTGNPLGGIKVYGFLFYAAPLLGLIGTVAAILQTFSSLGAVGVTPEQTSPRAIISNYAPAITATGSGLFMALMNILPTWIVLLGRDMIRS